MCVNKYIITYWKICITFFFYTYLYKVLKEGWVLKRIKMKLDWPCKMGLTNPCPWADKRQAQLM